MPAILLHKCFAWLHLAKHAEQDWFSETIFSIHKVFWRIKFHALMRDGSGLMGRFGGGWQWALGIELSRTTILLNLFVMTITFHWMSKEERKEALTKLKKQKAQPQKEVPDVLS